MKKVFFFSVVLLFSAARSHAQTSLDAKSTSDTALSAKDGKPETTQIQAKFPGGLDAWVVYLQENLNAKLGKKYIKLAKDQTSARQVAIVSFLVNKAGEVSEVTVTNPDEIHPKLAAEAVRVIQKSPNWIPAQQDGRKVIYRQIQQITFQTVREE